MLSLFKYYYCYKLHSTDIYSDTFENVTPCFWWRWESPRVRFLLLISMSRGETRRDKLAGGPCACRPWESNRNSDSCNRNDILNISRSEKAACRPWESNHAKLFALRRRKIDNSIYPFREITFRRSSGWKFPAFIRGNFFYTTFFREFAR